MSRETVRLIDDDPRDLDDAAEVYINELDSLEHESDELRMRSLGAAATTSSSSNRRSNGCCSTNRLCRMINVILFLSSIILLIASRAWQVNENATDANIGNSPTSITIAEYESKLSSLNAALNLEREQLEQLKQLTETMRQIMNESLRNQQQPLDSTQTQSQSHLSIPPPPPTINDAPEPTTKKENTPTPDNSKAPPSVPTTTVSTKDNASQSSASAHTTTSTPTSPINPPPVKEENAKLDIVFNVRSEAPSIDAAPSTLEPTPSKVQIVEAKPGVRKYRLACELKHGYDSSPMGEMGLGRSCVTLALDAPQPPGKHVFLITHNVLPEGGSFHVKHETCQSCRLFLTTSVPITNWVAENYGPDLIELRMYGPQILTKRVEPVTNYRNWGNKVEEKEEEEEPEGHHLGDDMPPSDYSLSASEQSQVRAMRNQTLWRSYCSEEDQIVAYPITEHHPPAFNASLNQGTSVSHPSPLECEYFTTYQTSLTGTYRIHLLLIYTAYQAIGDWYPRIWNQIWPRAQNVELILGLDAQEYAEQDLNQPLQHPQKFMQHIQGSQTFEVMARRAARSFDPTIMTKRVRVIDESKDNTLSLIPFTAFAPGGTWISLTSLEKKLPQNSHQLMPLQFWEKFINLKQQNRFQCQLINLAQYNWVSYEQRLLNFSLPAEATAHEPSGHSASSYLDEYEPLQWSSVLQCLKGKKIGFLGDSQTRAMFSRTVQLIGGPAFAKFKAVKQKFIDADEVTQWECVTAEHIELCYLPINDFYPRAIASGLQKVDIVVLNAGQHQASGPRRDSLASHYARRSKQLDLFQSIMFGNGTDSLNLSRNRTDALYYWFTPYFPRNNMLYTYNRTCGEGRTNPRIELFNSITISLLQNRSLLASPSHLIMDTPHMGMPFQDCAIDGAHQVADLFDVYIAQLVQKFMINLKCPVVGKKKEV